MTTPATVDFEMYQGDTKEITTPVVDQDGAVVDLTGSVITWRLAPAKWKHISPIAAVLTKSTNISGEINVPDVGDNNVFTVYLQPADTRDLEAGRYYHEASAVLADGAIGICLTGTITIKRDLREALP